jgi:hypothetical protein
MAAALTLSHLGNLDPPNLQPAPRTIFGIRAGVGIGIVASLMDVGGGEVLIPVNRVAVDVNSRNREVTARYDQEQASCTSAGWSALVQSGVVIRR